MGIPEISSTAALRVALLAPPTGESDPNLPRWMPADLPAREALLDEEGAAASLRDTRRQLSGTPLSLARPSFRSLLQMLS